MCVVAMALVKWPMLTKNVESHFQIHVFQAFPLKIFSLTFERMIVGDTGDIRLMKLFIYLKHELKI